MQKGRGRSRERKWPEDGGGGSLSGMLKDAVGNAWTLSKVLRNMGSHRRTSKGRILSK